MIGQLKHNFISNEIWTLTFGGSFQRASIYKDDVLDEHKSNFKSDIRSFVEKELLPLYSKESISDLEHITQIYKLGEFSKKHEHILKKGSLNFGVCQKILNLFLKYKWCLGDIPTPPHFPVDRRIQENIKYNPIVSWTKFKDEKDYMKIVNFVRDIKSENESIAEYELVHFERGVKTN